MADDIVAPTVPPQPWFDPKTGAATEAFRRFILGERGRVTNVNSGAAQARADAAAAQATANAAAQQAADAVSGAAGSSSFYATLSTPSVSGSRLGLGAVTTNSVTATPTGGTGPYTYAWSYVSGDTGFTANSSTAATTTFTGSISALGQDKSAVWKCTITDSLLATCSANVGVTINELS